ncbi:FecR family protein [Spirosoma endbachense]|uniref:DUF4974 domain-containing protein n=1 Tax=Spirosoma endbachense TaxID=2666025 RepID=A0A6P1VNA6_9BACT|nr:FecR family protein [Spirosoma endbachense]QHV93908.1 DUF4974 domain-containing protein [Spirosoma endbachense]
MKHTDYRDYSVDDLTRDDYFRHWVINHNRQSEAFWLEWLDQNPDCADKVQLARAFLQALAEKDTALAPPELDHIMANILQAGEPTVVPLWRRAAFRVAASVLVLLGLGFVAFRYISQQADPVSASLAELSPTLASASIEMVNTTSHPQTIRLQDSSTVLLYPRAKLRYSKRIDPDRREVYLSGKAFFSITKNPKKPFWVYTDQISTQVLGTSFLVNSTASDAKVEVRTGRVSVYMRTDVRRDRLAGKNESAGMVLTPNQQVAFSSIDKRLVKSVVEQPVTLNESPSNDYIFDEAPISQVFELLERNYGLTFIYDAPSLKECYLTANLANESLFDKLNLICKITRSSYELVDGQIVIHSQGCDNK